MKKISVQSIGRSWKEALLGTWGVVKRPSWLIVALALAFLISLIIYFSINFGFYGSLMLSQLPFVDKLLLLWTMVGAMFGSYGDDLNGVLLAVVSLLQGVAIAVLIYTAKRNRKMDAQVVGRSGVALVAATIGLGCVPCGTSLLIPIMTIIFSSSAPALMGTANAVILVIALGLTIFALVRVGKVAYKHYVAEV